MKTIIFTLIYLISFSAIGSDIKESTQVQQFRLGPRTTITYRRGDNIILVKRIFEKNPGSSYTHVYDFVYLGQIYCSYFIGPHRRDKTECNQRLGHLEEILSKKEKGDTSTIADCIVNSLKKKLKSMPSHFSWIDSNGNGQDDRFYFIRYDDETHKWNLLEAFSISPDGTVTPATDKLLHEWKTEYAAWANK